jgi:hypothetical protein
LRQKLQGLILVQCDCLSALEAAARRKLSKFSSPSSLTAARLLLLAHKNLPFPARIWIQKQEFGANSSMQMYIAPRQHNCRDQEAVRVPKRERESLIFSTCEKHQRAASQMLSLKDAPLCVSLPPPQREDEISRIFCHFLTPFSR